nr:ATP synthase F0 subunit 8 [Rhabdopleura sp. NHMO H2137]
MGWVCFSLVKFLGNISFIMGCSFYSVI